MIGPTLLRLLLPAQAQVAAVSGLADVTAEDLLLAVSLFVAGVLCREAIRFISRRLERSARGRRSAFDRIFIESLAPPAGWAAALGGLYMAVYVLPVPPGGTLDVLLALGAKLVSLALAVWVGLRFVDRVCDHWTARTQETPTRLNDQAVAILRKVLKVVVTLAGGAVFLQNLGFSVGSILAGLGLGGMAVALAAKDSLANLFGALVVFWDRPFDVGDWVQVHGMEGEVEQVGFRSTRIRTLSDTVVTIPNSDFTIAPVVNWSKLTKRCVEASVGITYDTPPDKVGAALEAIRTIINQSAEFHHDSHYVRVQALAESAIEIGITCYTVTTSYREFLDVRSRFFLAILSRFHELGVRFAFPTRTVMMEKQG